MQSSQLMLAAVPLQQQIQACNKELMSLIDADSTPAQAARIHDLRDEIFSCKIEIQALQTRANRLLKEAQNMRDVYIEQDKQSRFRNVER
jgi:hypothetical protein